MNFNVVGNVCCLPCSLRWFPEKGQYSGWVSGCDGEKNDRSIARIEGYQLIHLWNSLGA